MPRGTGIPLPGRCERPELEPQPVGDNGATRRSWLRALIIRPGTNGEAHFGLLLHCSLARFLRHP